MLPECRLCRLWCSATLCVDMARLATVVQADLVHGSPHEVRYAEFWADCVWAGSLKYIAASTCTPKQVSVLST